MRKPRIYVSGPMAGAPGSSYTANIRQGIDAAEALERLGAVPFLPHTNALWGMVYPDKPIDAIIGRDLAWVEACDALVRLPGISSGGDAEVRHAKIKNVPVFFVALSPEVRSFTTGESRPLVSCHDDAERYSTAEPERFVNWLTSWMSQP